MGITADIKKRAFEILEDSHDGIRYSELVQQIHEAIPDSNLNTINGSTWNLDKKYSSQVYKPARGIFKLTKYRQTTESVVKAMLAEKRGEEDFYGPFANWFKAELNDCDNAIVMGGARSKIKWSNPDVLGTRKPERGSIIQFPIEIVSTEIKTSIADQELIIGFGQACAYRLFSHKSYLVIPKDAAPEIKDRLDALCRIFGIGFILFDVNNKDNPDFQVKIRATRYEPDMFFVNEFLKGLDKKDADELL